VSLDTAMPLTTLKVFSLKLLRAYTGLTQSHVASVCICQVFCTMMIPTVQWATGTLPYWDFLSICRTQANGVCSTINACIGPAMDYISMYFGVDSSSHFPLTAQTAHIDRYTNTQSEMQLITQPHAATDMRNKAK